MTPQGPNDISNQKLLDSVNRAFTHMQQHMDKRFDEVNAHLDRHDNKFEAHDEQFGIASHERDVISRKLDVEISENDRQEKILKDHAARLHQLESKAA